MSELNNYLPKTLEVAVKINGSAIASILLDREDKRIKLGTPGIESFKTSEEAKEFFDALVATYLEYTDDKDTYTENKGLYVDISSGSFFLAQEDFDLEDNHIDLAFWYEPVPVDTEVYGAMVKVVDGREYYISIDTSSNRIAFTEHETFTFLSNKAFCEEFTDKLIDAINDSMMGVTDYDFDQAIFVDMADGTEYRLDIEDINIKEVPISNITKLVTEFKSRNENSNETVDA